MSLRYQKLTVVFQISQLKFHPLLSAGVLCCWQNRIFYCGNKGEKLVILIIPASPDLANYTGITSFSLPNLRHRTEGFQDSIVRDDWIGLTVCSSQMLSNSEIRFL